MTRAAHLNISHGPGQKPRALRYAAASASESRPPTTVRPFLLRLLLCVTLLLNGIGAGMASVHVAMMDMPSGPTPAMQVEPAGADCPHAGAARAAATHDDPHPAAPGADDSDCLELCMGICMQQCHVLSIASASAMPMAAQLAPVPPLVAGPPSVRPHPLLRPPIAA